MILVTIALHAWQPLFTQFLGRHFHPGLPASFITLRHGYGNGHKLPPAPPMALPALPPPMQRALPRPADWLAMPPQEEALAQVPAETLALALDADLGPEDWAWELLEVAARDQELAQHLMEEEGWVLAEPSAPFIPGVYQ